MVPFYFCRLFLKGSPSTPLENKKKNTNSNQIANDLEPYDNVIREAAPSFPSYSDEFVSTEGTTADTGSSANGGLFMSLLSVPYNTEKGVSTWGLDMSTNNDKIDCIKPTKKQKGSKSRNRKASGVKQNHRKSQEAALERAFSDSTIDYVTQGVKKLSVGTREKVIKKNC